MWKFLEKNISKITDDGGCKIRGGRGQGFNLRFYSIEVSLGPRRIRYGRVESWIIVSAKVDIFIPTIQSYRKVPDHYKAFVVLLLKTIVVNWVYFRDNDYSFRISANKMIKLGVGLQFYYPKFRGKQMQRIPLELQKNRLLPSDFDYVYKRSCQVLQITSFLRNWTLLWICNAVIGKCQTIVKLSVYYYRQNFSQNVSWQFSLNQAVPLSYHH